MCSLSPEYAFSISESLCMKLGFHECLQLELGFPREFGSGQREENRNPRFLDIFQELKWSVQTIGREIQHTVLVNNVYHWALRLETVRWQPQLWSQLGVKGSQAQIKHHSAPCWPPCHTLSSCTQPMCLALPVVFLVFLLTDTGEDGRWSSWGKKSLFDMGKLLNSQEWFSAFHHHCTKIYFNISMRDFQHLYGPGVIILQVLQI